MVAKLPKIGVRLFGAVFLGGTFLYAWLYNEYVVYPRHPIPEQNKIVPFVARATTVYISPAQSDFLHWLYWINCCVLVIFIILTWLDEHKLRAQNPKHNIAIRRG